MDPFPIVRSRFHSAFDFNHKHPVYYSCFSLSAHPIVSIAITTMGYNSRWWWTDLDVADCRRSTPRPFMINSFAYFFALNLCATQHDFDLELGVWLSGPDPTHTHTWTRCMAVRINASINISPYPNKNNRDDGIEHIKQAIRLLWLPTRVI